MDAVSSALQRVPRRDYLPFRERPRARYDGPLPIGQGQTNSQPRTVADMLRLLDVSPGHRVLDVGAGSGWTTALLAELTGPGGLVVGVELEPLLMTFGAANLARTSRPWASIRVATHGVLGWPELAPYDRILVSAEPPKLPHELVEQLADPGRMVIPVAGMMLLVEHPGSPPSGITVTEHGHYRFVPLR